MDSENTRNLQGTWEEEEEEATERKLDKGDSIWIV